MKTRLWVPEAIFAEHHVRVQHCERQGPKQRYALALPRSHHPDLETALGKLREAVTSQPINRRATDLDTSPHRVSEILYEFMRGEHHNELKDLVTVWSIDVRRDSDYLRERTWRVSCPSDIRATETHLNRRIARRLTRISWIETYLTKGLREAVERAISVNVVEPDLIDGF